MERTRAYRRDVRKRAIKRKKRICRANYGWDWYKVDGKYSKGKINNIATKFFLVLNLICIYLYHSYCVAYYTTSSMLLQSNILQ